MIEVTELIKHSSDHSQTVQAMSDIEALVQTHEAWSYKAVMDLLEQDSVYLLLAIEDTSQQIVGYCLYQSLFEQAEILRIGTHPQYQRQGIASALFFALHNTLQVGGAKSLLLEVRADNQPAIALYARQGFKVIHRRQNYYQSKNTQAVDALIMQLMY